MMYTLLLALTVAAPPPPDNMLPVEFRAVTIRPGAKTTGVPELDRLLIEAKRTGTPVAKLFNEDGQLQWFKATPDGWLSKIPPPVERPVVQVVPVPVQPPPPAYQPAPRQEVAAAYQAPTFQRGQRIPGTPYHEGHRCPACNYESPDGEGTWVVRGGAKGGVHVHSCPRCGQSWKHRG